MKTSTKLGLLGSLYLSQGLPFGFFTQALPVLLRQQGASLPAIGLSNLLALPWALKFLWAPLMDRRASGRLGKRRGAIVPLQALAAATLAAVAALPPGKGMAFVLAAVLLTNLFAATQDIATDGLAVDLLARGERGLGNGVQVAGYRVGMILGGGLMLVLMDRLGWASTFLAMSGMLLACTVPVLLFREKSVPAAGGERLRLTEGLQREGVWGWLALLLLYKSGENFATGMLRTFLVDAGLGLADVGQLLGWVGFTAGLVGALAGGAGVNVLGRRRALIVFGLLQAVGVGSYALAARGVSLPGLYAVCALEHFTSGMATAALFTAMMDACRPAYAATDYTVQACAVVVATGLAAGVSGFSAQAFGYAAHFLLAGGLCVLAALYVLLLPRSARALGLEIRPEVG